MKYQIFLKNLLAAIWGLLAIAVGSIVIWIHIESQNSVYGNDAAWLYSVVSLFLIAPLSLLSYGLFKSRRWVFRWYSILVAVFLFFGTIATFTVGQDLIRTRDASTAMFFLMVWIFPLLAELFLFKIRKTVLCPASQSNERIVLLSTILGGVALIPVVVGGIMLLIFSVMLGPRKERIEHTSIENDRYRVTVYHLPSTHATVGEYTKVVMVDKDSFFKGEKELLWTRGREKYRLEFTDSTTVQIPGSTPDKNMIFDLAHPTGMNLDRLEWPMFREKLMYEGCENEVLAENDSYIITLRKYPPSNPTSKGLIRLLVKDKTDWFPSEEILLEAWRDDSITAKLAGNDSLSVTITLHNRIHRQTGQLNGTFHHEFDLAELTGFPIHYPSWVPKM